MLPMIASVLGIAALTAAMVLAAGAEMHITHMALAAIMALILAFAALSDNQKALADSESPSAIASKNARYMGLVWSWGALVLAVTYGLLLSWSEWWQFLIAFILLAGLCLFFSILLREEDNKLKADTNAQEDQTIHKIARFLAIFQLVGAVVAMLGLLIDGKMTRFMNPRHTDWAANNVFFFGAMALAIISYLALRSNSKAGR